MIQQQTTTREHKELIRAMFEEVFTSPTYDQKAVDRYFDAGYIQTVDGKTLSFDQFCQHVRVQKQALRRLTIHFKTLVGEDDIIFSNHTARVETVEGRSGEIHVIAEFRFLNSKIVACDELSRMLSGDCQDSDLGSRH